MFENIVPILYYSPATIDQITAGVQGEILLTETQTRRSDMELSLKTVFKKMWIVKSSEAKGEYGRTKEKTFNSAYNELSRAIATVKEIQRENRLLLQGRVPNIAELPNAFSLFQGQFNIKLIRAKIDDSYMVEVEHESDGLQIHGITSIDNWTSKSLINQLLVTENVNASALVYPLSIQGKRIEVKFACIFVM